MFGLPEKPRKLITLDRMRPNPIDPPGVRLDIGHIAPKPGSDYKTRLFLYEQKLRALKNSQLKDFDWDKNHTMLLQEFIDATSKRSANTECLRLMEFALQAEEERLNNKRERLRKLLTEEETFYKNEFQNHFLNTMENDIIQRELRLLSIQKERERANEEFVKQKRIQQYLEKCDEIRPYLRQELLIDSKQCQLKQIMDKKLQKKEAEDLENIWLEIARRRNEIEDKKQEDIERLKELRHTCAINEIKEHMQMNMQEKEMKKLRHLEEKIIDDKNMQQLVEEDKQIEDMKKQKRLKLKNDLMEQLQESTKSLANRKREEEQFQKLFDLAIENELKMEKSEEAADAVRLRHENNMYLDYLKNIKKERSVIEAARTKIIEDFQCKIATDEDNRKRELEAQKLAAKMEMIKGRNQQIRENAEKKKKKEEKEFNEAVNVRKIYAFNNELEEDSKMRKRIATQSYAKQLQEQIEYNKLQKQKQEEESRIEAERIRNEENKCRDMVQNFLLKGAQILPIHPTLEIIQNNSGNYKMKRPPNCYCP